MIKYKLMQDALLCRKCSLTSISLHFENFNESNIIMQPKNVRVYIEKNLKFHFL